MALSLHLTDAPGADDLVTISEGLTGFNEADAGPADKKLLAITLSETDGSIFGGLSGYTAWGWLYVQWLWLDARQRGGGWAGRMLDMAEAEARARGCHGAYIDTFNPVALKVYQRQGYRPFGQLEDFPRGRTRTFLQKRL